MKAAKALEPLFVDTFPGALTPGVLYVSAKYSTASHLCACGCGREVVTPLSPSQWKVTFDGSISVWPSIGNWTLPCRSHYVIRQGHVRWARPYSDDEVRENQKADTRALNRQAPHDQPRRSAQPRRSNPERD